MNRIWIRASAALILIFAMLMLMITAKASPVLATEASAMAVIECDTGMLLYEKNKDLRLPMASTTKIMTALLTLEYCRPDEMVKIADDAVGVEGSSIYLQNGEIMSVKDLLYGLMLASGNDAAVALACKVGGSVEGFVELMNAKAAQMGLTSTHFVTPNGLHDDEHLTTAYELCLIAREALKNELFRMIVSTKYYKTETGNVNRTFKNKNSLLWNYDGAFGVKTGYTMAAGRCLVFGAERDGMTVIGALLNCRPMFEEAPKLLDSAFDSFVKETVIGKGTHVLDVYIENGEQNVLEVEAKESIIAVMRKSEIKSFRILPRLCKSLSAPIAKGSVVGRLDLYDGDELIASAPLAAANTVDKRDLNYWWRFLAGAFAGQ